MSEPKLREGAKKYPETYKPFIAYCLQDFDSRAEACELLASATRFDRIRVLFTSGEGTLNPLFADPLMGWEVEAREKALAYHRDARKLGHRYLREVDEALSLLVEYCLLNVMAKRRRARGRISQALKLENSAREARSELPEVWRW